MTHEHQKRLRDCNLFSNKYQNNEKVTRNLTSLLFKKKIFLN